MEPQEIEGMIEEIVGQVQSWGKETLVEFVQDRLREQLRTFSPEQVQKTYEDFSEYHPCLASSHYTKMAPGPGGTLAWYADLSHLDGPVLGPYPTRKEAVEAEAEWINV